MRTLFTFAGGSGHAEPLDALRDEYGLLPVVLPMGADQRDGKGFPHPVLPPWGEGARSGAVTLFTPQLTPPTDHLIIAPPVGHEWGGVVDAVGADAYTDAGMPSPNAT